MFPFRVDLRAVVLLCLSGLLDVAYGQSTEILPPLPSINAGHHPVSFFEEKLKFEFQFSSPESKVPAYTLAPPPEVQPDISIEPIDCTEPVAELGFPPFPANLDLPVWMPKSSSRKPANETNQGVHRSNKCIFFSSCNDD